MKPLGEQRDRTPEEQAAQIGLVYGPPSALPEQTLKAMQEAALHTQEIAEEAFMVYGPPNMPGGFAQTIEQQMQQRISALKPAGAAGWKCIRCGTENNRNFCMECGSPKPEPPSAWQCRCGAENTGKFCTECGASRTERG